MTLNTLERVMLANEYDITVDTGSGYVFIHMDYIKNPIDKHAEALKLLKAWGKAKVKYVNTIGGVIKIDAEMK